MRNLCLTALIISLAISLPASGFDRSDGTVVQCEVERQGVKHLAKEIWLGHGDLGDRHPELGGAAAVVRPDDDGWPVIYFDSVVIKAMLARDPHMSDFIFYHECAHAQVPERDEIEANCEAFLELERQGLLNPSKQDALATTHKKMLRLPSRYGGSGEIFWERTLACVRNKNINNEN